MKLSPPASSSDLEAAREVARRLNRIATPAEPPRPLPPYTPLPGARAASLSPPARPFAAVPPPVAHPQAPHAPVAPVPPPPAIAPMFAPPEPEPAPEIKSGPEPEPEAHVAATEAPPERESTTAEESVARPYVETPPAAPVSEVPPAAPMPVASAPPLPAQAALPEGEPDTGPVQEEVEEIEEGTAAEDQAEEAEDYEAVVPLTWSEIISSCQALAEGKGALLIAPEGRVIAVSGDWPSPGAEAIAARLVPAMDKALKDAPTRSVSVPLGGLHLTAWRAPMASGLMTIGFVADAPLRPDLRPAIDATLKKGPQD